MKNTFKNVLAILASVALATAAFAQNYPYTKATYIPSAIAPSSTLSTTGTYAIDALGLSTVTFQISGTCTSLAATPQISTNGGTTWTDVKAAPVAGGSLVSSITTAGAYRINAAGTNKVRLNVTALAASCTFSGAGTTGSGPMYAVGDPCQNPDLMKSSAAINISSATTTAVVALAAGKTTHVCEFSATAAGTNPTILFLTGTETTTPCDTGAANLSGTFAPTAGTAVRLGGSGTVMKSAAAGQLCITSGGTPSIQGVLTYVQQ